MKKTILILFVFISISCIKKEYSQPYESMFFAASTGAFLYPNPSVNETEKEFIPKYENVFVSERSIKKYIINEIEDYWYKATYEKETGWINGWVFGGELVTSVNLADYFDFDSYVKYPSDKSYRLEAGTYYTLAGRVNVRSEPNLNGSVLGQLDVNTEVEILECTLIEEAIDGFWAFWYKIEYEKSYGYIWGGYIAYETFVYDIDKNGVDDYFHYRCSIIIDKYGYHSEIVNVNNDIFIYINDNLLDNHFYWERFDDREYISCTIYSAEHFVEAYSFGYEYISDIESVIYQFYANPWAYFFEVNKDGKIMYIHAWAK